MTRQTVGEIEGEIDQQLIDALPNLDFAEALPDLKDPKELDKTAPSIIRYLIQVGDKGYKDGVDLITDDQGNPPNQENSWLYDAGEKQFKGRFVDQRPGGDRVFSFTIQMGGGEPVRTFQPISGVAD